MTDSQPIQRYRFGTFEADAATGELRRGGVRIKLNAQPFQVLVLLLRRPGELLTRDEISRELWPGDTFVDFEHGVNSAVNRIREALGDSASNPRFVQTLARRGYRFLAPVEPIPPPERASALPPPPEPPRAATPEPITPVVASAPEARWSRPLLATSQDLPRASPATVQILFILLQVMYLGFYVGALANLAEIEDLFSALPHATQFFLVTVVTAAVLIPLRAFLICAALFRPPGLPTQFRKLWPFLLVFDELWALSPFLLLHHISYGLALACTTLLVYSPFAQRSLMLMGAGRESETVSANARDTR